MRYHSLSKILKGGGVHEGRYSIKYLRDEMIDLLHWGDRYLLNEVSTKGENESTSIKHFINEISLSFNKVDHSLLWGSTQYWGIIWLRNDSLKMRVVKWWVWLSGWIPPYDWIIRRTRWMKDKKGGIEVNEPSMNGINTLNESIHLNQTLNQWDEYPQWWEHLLNQSTQG